MIFCVFRRIFCVLRASSRLLQLHTNTLEKLARVTDIFRIRGYKLLCPATAEGRGGAAIVIKDTWNVISFVHRVLQASVNNGEGDVLSMASVHMHHRCSNRTSQWGPLLRDRYCLPADTLIFGDFNSVIMPARDIAAPQARSEGDTVIQLWTDPGGWSSSLLGRGVCQMRTRRFMAIRLT